MSKQVTISISDEDWAALKSVDIYRIFQAARKHIKLSEGDVEDILVADKQLEDISMPLSRIQHAIRNQMR